MRSSSSWTKAVAEKAVVEKAVVETMEVAAAARSQTRPGSRRRTIGSACSPATSRTIQA
jgi:hypothetical protein